MRFFFYLKILREEDVSSICREMVVVVMGSLQPQVFLFLVADHGERELSRTRA